MKARKRVEDRRVPLGCAHLQCRANVSRLAMPRGARLVRKSSNRSKKIPLNPPFSEGGAFELPPWPPCSASWGGPVRKELDMVAHPDGMRPRWKRRAGEDFTEPVSFIDHLELRRGPLLLMKGLEGHCERSEAISVSSGDCFVAGAPRNDGWILFLPSITPPPGGVCRSQLPVLMSAGA